jgi:ABC-2 type transport system ATP-binding protein
MLEARKLSKRYGERLALEGLDLKVEPGEVFCLLGANGAGKTTTLNLFLGFIEPTEGEARVGGLEVRTHGAEVRQRLAYVPERFGWPSACGGCAAPPLERASL